MIDLADRPVVGQRWAAPILRVFMALLLTVFLVPVTPAYAAFAGVNTSSLDNPATNALNADDEGVGSTDNPYRILIGQGAFCRPSAFWSNGGNQASGGGQSIPDMAITFENRVGGTPDGTLLTSYIMDTRQRDGQHLNESWTYAFRFGPYVATDTSTGELRFATASKGSFEFYFPTFQFKLNVAELTKDLDEGNRLQPGDAVSVTYYGGYDENQTSRGTDYAIDFDTTDENTSYSDDFFVDEDGFITIDPLPTGGNYTVKKLGGDEPEDPSTYVPYHAQGNNSTLKLTGISVDDDGSALAATVNDTAKNVIEEGTTTTFFNRIREDLPYEDGISFTYLLDGGGTRWVTLATGGVGKVHLYDDESLSPESLLYTPVTEDFSQGVTEKNRLTVNIPTEYLAGDSTYYLVFDPSICTRDASQSIKATIVFRFSTVPGPGGSGVDATPVLDAINQATAVRAGVEVGIGNGDYPQGAADALSEAIADAQGLYDNGSLITEGLVNRTVRTLNEAVEHFYDQRIFEVLGIEITGIPTSIVAGDGGTASAAVSSDPQDEKYGAVTWSASANIAINEATGVWTTKDWGLSFIKATSVSDPSVSKQVDFAVAAPISDYAFDYTFDEGTATAAVSGFTCNNLVPIDVVIPATVEHEGKTYTVTSIPDGDRSSVPFAAQGQLVKSLTLPDTLTSVGSYAFDSLTNMRSIDLGGAVTIGEQAFHNSGVRSLDIPETVREVGDAAFLDTRSMTSVTGMKGLTELPYHVFAHTGLESIDIPDNVTTLGVAPFNGSSHLASVTGMKGVTEFGDAALGSMSSLKSVELPEGMTVIPDKMFWDDHALESVEVPEGVTTIGEGAFYSCFGMKSAVMPDSVTEIGAAAFSQCRALESVRLSNSLEVIPIQLFLDCENLSDINLPTDLRQVQSSAFRNCQSLEELVFSETLQLVDQGAFMGCSSLDKLIFLTRADDVPTFGRDAFMSAQDVTVRGYGEATTVKQMVESYADAGFVFDVLANMDELQNALLPAEKMLSEAAESRDGADVSPDVFWTTPETRGAFETIVVGARGMVADVETSQEDVDAATEALVGATAVFDAARQCGTMQNAIGSDPGSDTAAGQDGATGQELKKLPEPASSDGNLAQTGDEVPLLPVTAFALSSFCAVSAVMLARRKSR